MSAIVPQLQEISSPFGGSLSSGTGDPDAVELSNQVFGGYWLAVRDGDPRVVALYNRHYSAYRYRDGRVRNRIVGPGERIVLLTSDCSALFVWKKFRDASGQQGINCAVFRNEGSLLSSLLILEAEVYAARRWPGQRFYTYVSSVAVRSSNPGCCFKKAGWALCGRTATRGLLIFEKGGE
jgi:hypothetical protein